MFLDNVCRFSIQNYAPVLRLWKNGIISYQHEVYFTRHGLGGQGFEPQWGRDCVPIQTGPKAHPASVQCVLGLFSRFEWPACGADHPSLSIAGVECGKPIPLPPPCVFIVCYGTAFTFTVNHWYIKSGLYEIGTVHGTERKILKPACMCRTDK